jgi:predicted anti-sigma-YlaC factor YlaD
MRCEEIEILLSAYVDDEVSTEERDIVEQHLEQCSPCQSTVAAFSGVHGLYQSLDMKEAPVDFRQRVTQRLAVPNHGWLPWQWPRLAYVAALSLLIVIGGVIGTVSLQQNRWWLSSGQYAEQIVEVYAEDILFGETVFVTEDIFAVEDTSVAEEILDNIGLFEAET